MAAKSKNKSKKTTQNGARSNVKNTKSLQAKTSGRPMPMTPKAGFTQTPRRYGKGGKLCK